MTDLIRAVILTGAVVLMGCGSNPPELCTPGVTESCSGVGKCGGQRTCDAQGSSYSDCQCPNIPDSGMGGGSALGGGTGGGSATGGGSGGGTVTGGGAGGGTVTGGGTGGGTVTGGGTGGGSGGGTTGGGTGGGTTTGGGTGGGTPNPCAGITCTTPPVTSCTSASTRRAYSSPGTCSAGTCNYTFTDFNCPFGCAGGACKVDPCAGVTCTALDQCHSIGTCTAGVCSNPLKAAGSSCNDENLCTLSDTCNAAGACVGGPAMTCPAPSGICQVASCNPSTGVCGSTAAPDNTICYPSLSDPNVDGRCRTSGGVTNCRTAVMGASCSITCYEGTCSPTTAHCVPCGAVGQPCCADGPPLYNAPATNCRFGLPNRLCCVPTATCSGSGNTCQ